MYNNIIRLTTVGLTECAKRQQMSVCAYVRMCVCTCAQLKTKKEMSVNMIVVKIWIQISTLCLIFTFLMVNHYLIIESLNHSIIVLCCPLVPSTCNCSMTAWKKEIKYEKIHFTLKQSHWIINLPQTLSQGSFSKSTSTLISSGIARAGWVSFSWIATWE